MTTSSGANMTVTELTEDQIAEQNERANERDAVNGGQEDNNDEGGQQQRTERAEGEGEGEPAPREKPIAMSPQDLKRQQMADRFKRPGVEERPFDGDMANEENLYGDVALKTVEDDPDAPEPGVPADQQRAAPAPAADDRIHTIIVRGKEVKLTTAQLLERASKVEAADSYLDESRQLLEAAKSVREGERAAPESRRHGTEDRAQDDEVDANRDQSSHRPGLDLKSVVEKIQFGDPEEAATELAKAINTVATQQVNEGHVQRLVSNDLARAKMDLKAFSDANPELAKDELSSKAIENLIYSIYREEIQKLGVDEAQIPKDPKQLADWHRLYRVHGHPVSKTSDVLNTAKARFVEWRGTSSQPAKPAKPAKEAPRVAVNVDRTERRMAIPTQPSRGVAPRRDAAPVTQENSRKSAVQEMRRARGQPVV